MWKAGQAYSLICICPGRLPHSILALHVQQCGCYHLGSQPRIKGEWRQWDALWEGVGSMVKNEEFGEISQWVKAFAMQE